MGAAIRAVFQAVVRALVLIVTVAVVLAIGAFGLLVGLLTCVALLFRGPRRSGGRSDVIDVEAWRTDRPPPKRIE